MGKEYNRVEGIEGELIAAAYLKKKKYKVLLQNYKNKMGEIDIIAKLKKMYVFVEVKARNTLAFGQPSEAVNEEKQRKIRAAATLFLIQQHLTEEPVRFDVIEIVGDELNHIENAF